MRLVRSAGMVLLVVTAVSLAAAAALTVSGSNLGAGSASLSCDPAGMTVTQNLSSTNIASVAVGGVASACAGGTLKVTVNNGTTSSNGSATVPAGGGTVTVTLATAVAVKDAHYTTLLVQGP